MYQIIAMCVILGASKMLLDYYDNVQRHIKQTDELLLIVKEIHQIVKNKEN